MDIKTILKSFGLGTLLALAAIRMEFRFFFCADDIVEMHPGAGSLFVLQLLLFFGIIFLLSVQNRLLSDGGTQKRFHAGILLQIALLAIWFLVIMGKPLLLFALAMISWAFTMIGAALYFWKRDKQHLLQGGVYFLTACLCLLLLTTTYWAEI